MRLITRRADSRRNVQMEARLIAAGRTSPALIENLSEQGAKLIVTEAPATGDEVVVRWACFAALGRVAWVDGRDCGLEFDRRLDTRVVEATLLASADGS